MERVESNGFRSGASAFGTLHRKMQNRWSNGCKLRANTTLGSMMACTNLHILLIISLLII